MKSIIELLKDAAECGHQIGYTETDGEAEPDCEPDCTGCRAFEEHEIFKDFPTVVCLCGSTRFWREFQRASLRETMEGKIVLTIGAATGTDDEHFGNLPPDEYRQAKKGLDELHKRKIDLADEVLILNVGGYIGESTRSELEHAKKRGKTIRFLEPP